MRQFDMVYILFLGLLCLGWSQKNWELKQEDLENMIQQSNLIVTGKIIEVPDTKALELKISEILLGGQIRRIPLTLTNGRTFDPELNYIAFLKQNKNSFVPVGNLGIIKSDLMLANRVRSQILKFKLENSSYVVLATITNLEETTNEQNIQVTVNCKTVVRYRGNLPEDFVIKYNRISGQQPAMLTLFNNLNYIFFLKGEANDPQLINLYDAALLEQAGLLRELKKTAESNPWDSSAGVSVDGLALFAEADATFKVGDPIPLVVGLRNVTDNIIEIYHDDEQLAYFVVFHLVNAENKIVPSAYRPSQDIPGEINKNNFLKLVANDEFLFPTFELQQYYNLVPGKYFVYVEYNLHYRYSGKSIGKAGWSGKVVSNAILIEIVP